MKFSLTKKKEENTPKHFSWNPIHPRRDWQRLLIVFIVLAFAIGAWSGYLFFLIGQKEDSPVQVVQENSTAKKIERISSFFEKREQK